MTVRLDRDLVYVCSTGTAAPGTDYITPYSYIGRCEASPDRRESKKSQTLYPSRPQRLTRHSCMLSFPSQTGYLSFDLAQHTEGDTCRTCHDDDHAGGPCRGQPQVRKLLANCLSGGALNLLSRRPLVCLG